MNDLQTKYLYALSAYGAIHFVLFTVKPEIPTKDSFGEEEVNNEPCKLMTSVLGTTFGVIGVSSYVLAKGYPPATAMNCGMSLIPLRMAYDVLVSKVTPPPPAIVMTLGLCAFGLYVDRKSN